MSFPSFLKIITKQGLNIISLSKLLCLSFSFKIAFQQLFSVHTQACDHAPWRVCGANLQGQLARVGSFYSVGSKGANSGWQAWWQVPLPPESYHQHPLYLLTRVIFPHPPLLPLPPTFPVTI